MNFQLTENVKLLGINFCIKQKMPKITGTKSYRKKINYRDRPRWENKYTWKNPNNPHITSTTNCACSKNTLTTETNNKPP